MGHSESVVTIAFVEKTEVLNIRKVIWNRRKSVKSINKRRNGVDSRNFCPYLSKRGT